MDKRNIISMKKFKNAYCDALSCGLGKFLFIDEDNYNEILSNLSRGELELICDYVVLKNKIAGVGDLNIKVPYAQMGKKSLEKYGLEGNEILSAECVNGLSTKDLVGGRMIVEVSNLQNYNEGALSDISSFCATTDTPILIHFGRDLAQVGLIVNRFGSSPAQTLENFGLLDRECLLYGMNFIDKDDQILLSQYDPTIILSPQSDGEEGKGAINLYNLIYNRLKFVFSSGKCYNVNMLGECRLAKINTNNLMYESKLIDAKDLLAAVQSNVGEIKIEYDQENRFDVILDLIVSIQDASLHQELMNLEGQIKTIVQKLKEKLNGN